MAMTEAYRNSIADHGATLITHIGLVDDLGNELTGGSPAYARKPVTWTAAAAGSISPTADTTFDVPAGATVGGWRGYSALTLGTDYGGADLTHEVFAGQGTYQLLAAGTAINHNQAV